MYGWAKIQLALLNVMSVFVLIGHICVSAFVLSPFPFCPVHRLFFSLSVPKFQHLPSQYTMDFVSNSKGSVSSALIAIFAAWLVYVVAQAVHRAWFSPIAGFPGSKLAAVSFW
jgi:hypothetical protein